MTVASEAMALLISFLNNSVLNRANSGKIWFLGFPIKLLSGGAILLLKLAFTKDVLNSPYNVVGWAVR